jgi:hypothetical protein
MYNSDPAVQLRITAQSEVTRENMKACELQTALTALQQRRRAIKTEESAERATLQGRIDEARLEEARETNIVQVQLNRMLSQIAKDRQQTESERDSVLRTVCGNFQGEVKRLDAELAAIPNIEAHELADTLAKIQRQQTDDFLRRQLLKGATIRGIGEFVKRDLRNGGFNTAADIDLYKVQCISGIGPTRAHSLAAWRKRMEVRAIAEAPQHLPQNVEAGVRTRFAQKQQQLSVERAQWQARLQSETDKITVPAAAKLATLSQNLLAVQSDACGRTAAIKRLSADKINVLVQKQREMTNVYAAKARELDGNIQERTKDLCQQNWRLAKANREFSRYSGVSFGAMVKRVFLLR